MNKKLFSELNLLLKKYRGVLLDIIVFGSSVRGKKFPKDLDIILFFRNTEDEDVVYAIRKFLEGKGVVPDIISKDYDSLFDKNFLGRESILSEGFSVLHNGFLSQKAGYSNGVLLKYDLRGLTKSKRILFYYALHGRNGAKGVVDVLGLRKMFDGAVFCPVNNLEDAKSFFIHHNILFEEIPVLIPERLTE